DWAARENRVLLTHDFDTLIGHAWDRVRAGRPMAGVVALRQGMAIGRVIDELELLAGASDAGAWADQVLFVTPGEDHGREARCGQVAAFRPAGLPAPAQNPGVGAVAAGAGEPVESSHDWAPPVVSDPADAASALGRLFIYSKDSAFSAHENFTTEALAW